MPDRIRPGQPLDAATLNALVDAVLDRIRAGAGTSLTRTQGGVVISAPATHSAPLSGGIMIDQVSTLPPIPTDRPRIVWWSGSDGDNQLWAACPGQSRWTPLQNWTWLDGTPDS